jgi:hypothetical protein
VIFCARSIEHDAYNAFAFGCLSRNRPDLLALSTLAANFFPLAPAFVSVEAEASVTPFESSMNWT